MSGKTLIDGTICETKKGKMLIDGTAYGIAKGKALVDGTKYTIKFTPDPLNVFLAGVKAGTYKPRCAVYDFTSSTSVPSGYTDTDTYQMVSQLLGGEDNSCIQVISSSDAYVGRRGFVTIGPVNFTEYTTLHCTASTTNGNVKAMILGYCPDSDDNLDFTANIAESAASTAQEFTLDISGVTGKQYIKFEAYGFGYTTSYKKIWLT